MSTVLVVDDELDAREAVARYLRRAGHVVCCAGNGREALRVLFDHAPDLVVLDARMPIMDGVNFLVRARAPTRVRRPSRFTFVSHFARRRHRPGGLYTCVAHF